MSKKDRLLRTVNTIGFALILGVSLTACGAGSEKWKEEVQLSDGKIIVVERELVLESGGDEWAANRSGSKPKEYRIQFADPSDAKKMIEWHSKKKDSSTWPEVPLILNVEADKFVVFSSVFNAVGCHIYSKYLYRNGAWDEEKLAATFEQRTTNLYLKLGIDMPSFVDLKQKNAINADGRFKKAYKQVGPNLKVCSG